MSTRYFGAPVPRNEDARLLTGRALFVDDIELPGMLHAAFVRSPHAHARIRSVDVSAALRREGVVAVYTAEDLGDYWKPGPLLVPPPPIEGAVFNERTPGAAGQGQGAPRRRAGGDGHRREPLPRRGCARPTWWWTTSRCRRWWISSARSQPMRRACTTTCRATSPPMCARRKRRLCRGGEARASRNQAALLLRPRQLFADRDARRGGAVGRQADKLTVWDTTQAPVVDPQRPRGDARPVRAPGARGRALHRRRLRPEDHDVLPGGGARSLGGDAARAAR